MERLTMQRHPPNTWTSEKAIQDELKSPSTVRTCGLMASLVSFSAPLPLAWLSISSIGYFLQFQLIGIIYASMLIVYTVGSQWVLALKSQRLWLLQNSLLCTLVPWMAISLKHQLHYDIENVWMVITLETLYLLYLDLKPLKEAYPRWYLHLRVISTCMLTLAQTLIIYRNFDL